MTATKTVKTCFKCRSVLGQRFERIGPVNDMKYLCWDCHRDEFPSETLPITVAELIEQLQALPESAKGLPVSCSYDGGCATGVFGVGIPYEADDMHGGGVCLSGE